MSQQGHTTRKKEARKKAYAKAESLSTILNKKISSIGKQLNCSIYKVGERAYAKLNWWTTSNSTKIQSKWTIWTKKLIQEQPLEKQQPAEEREFVPIGSSGTPPTNEQTKDQQGNIYLRTCLIISWLLISYFS